MNGQTSGALRACKLGNNADQWELVAENGRTEAIVLHGGETNPLLAAAPDLLASLKSLLDEPISQKTYYIARVAIAKAEGSPAPAPHY